ncbi:hypothetical protein [Gordonia humi]|uniref:Uncharacterized protein n=1 Tax=Gordonia humi TaxID=686429 RepID=A0A840EY76_9ACTN|nr:hypothetical protein [Gordonia humi]MBB4134736.1 hypothetical protein [Gordonia humi]
MISPNPATDHLIRAARVALGAAEWLLESASDHGHADGCCDAQSENLSTALLDMPRLLAQFDYYSDGRPILSFVSIDGDSIIASQLWPADPADHPTSPFDSPKYSLPPDREPGDRGYAVVTWDPSDFTGTVRYIEPLTVVRSLEVVR